MCDPSLGRVLDFMDEHDMWDDTMLLVNTDHGFLLGEHGWWAKIVQPWFNELVHLPMFLWDPRTGERHPPRRPGPDHRHRADDPRFFGLEPPPDMQGRDLAAVDRATTPCDEGALFGIHGGHVNVTDGRFVYMRAAANRERAARGIHPDADPHAQPVRTRRTRRVGAGRTVLVHQGVAHHCGCRPARSLNSWRHGTLLFDLETDPEQDTRWSTTRSNCGCCGCWPG